MDTALATTFGNAARSARANVHLTQAQVAEQVGLACEVYARLERGTRLPRLTTLMRLCTALRTSPDVLLGIARVDRRSASRNGRPELARLQPELLKLTERSVKCLRMFLLANVDGPMSRRQ